VKTVKYLNKLFKEAGLDFLITALEQRGFERTYIGPRSVEFIKDDLPITISLDISDQLDVILKRVNI